MRYSFQIVITLNYLFVGIVDSPLNSLFTYQPGQSWITFYDPYFIPDYEPVFSSTELAAEAMTLCGQDAECLFDIAATDIVEIGEVTLEIGMEIEETLTLQIRSKYTKWSRMGLVSIILYLYTSSCVPKSLCIWNLCG